jgi:hypothetical protein
MFISHDLISYLLKVGNVFIVNTVPVIIENHKDPDQLFIHIDPLNNYLNIVNKEREKDIKAIHIDNMRPLQNQAFQIRF